MRHAKLVAADHRHVGSSGVQARLPGGRIRAPDAAARPNWLIFGSEADRRRLTAYTVLAAYDTTQAAALLGEDGDDSREYGDASLIVDQTLSHPRGRCRASAGRQRYAASPDTR